MGYSLRRRPAVGDGACDRLGRRDVDPGRSAARSPTCSGTARSRARPRSSRALHRPRPYRADGDRGADRRAPAARRRCSTTPSSRAAAARERNVVGAPLWPALRRCARSGCSPPSPACLVLLGGLVQINPVWLWGPYHPYLGENGAQPDWYLGWLIGALRMMPNWEPTIGGQTIVPNPFWGGVLFPLIVFGLLYAWPLLERRLSARPRRPPPARAPARQRPRRTGVRRRALHVHGRAVLRRLDGPRVPPVRRSLRGRGAGDARAVGAAADRHRDRRAPDVPAARERRAAPAARGHGAYGRARRERRGSSPGRRCSPIPRGARRRPAGRGSRVCPPRRPDLTRLELRAGTRRAGQKARHSALAAALLAACVLLVLAALAAAVAAVVLAIEALGAPLWLAALITAAALCMLGAGLALAARRTI